MRGFEPLTPSMRTGFSRSNIRSTIDPTGDRFLVKDYPKDKEHRQLRISQQMAAKLALYIKSEGIDEENLLFPMLPSEQTAPRPLRLLPDPKTLGMTEPNAKGKQYKHGTISAYNAAPCSCEHCKAAYAIYRARRRSQGKDSPRNPKTVNTDGHIPRRWFLEHIWQPALKAAKLRIHVRVHDLPHAHASWLLAGGADLQVVKERLGHANIATTSKYLHTLPESDDTALDAFRKIRNRSEPANAESTA